MPSWIVRGLSWLAALVVGALYGIAATIAHSFVWLHIPVGLIVGAISCAGLLVALRTLTGDRWTAAAGGLGLLVTLFIVSQPGPGGSIVVANTLLGQIWTYLAAAIVLVVVAWPDLSRRPRTTA